MFVSNIWNKPAHLNWISTWRSDVLRVSKLAGSLAVRGAEASDRAVQARQSKETDKECSSSKLATS